MSFVKPPTELPKESNRAELAVFLGPMFHRAPMAVRCCSIIFVRPWGLQKLRVDQRLVHDFLNVFPPVRDENTKQYAAFGDTWPQTGSRASWRFPSTS